MGFGMVYGRDGWADGRAGGERCEVGEREANMKV